MGTGFGVSRGAVATHPKRACRARPPDWGWVVPAHWNPSLEPKGAMVLRSPEGEARARGVAAAGILVGDVGGRCARGPGGGHSRGTEDYAVAEAVHAA